MKTVYGLFIVLLSAFGANAQEASREQFKFAKFNYDNKNFEAALEHVDKAIEEDTSYAGAYFMRALINFDSESYRQSMEDINHAIKQVDARSSSAADYLFLRARVHLMLANERDALTDLNNSIRISGTNIEALLERAELKKAKNDYRGAIADISYAIQLNTPANAELYALRADMLNEFYRPKYGSDEYKQVLGDIDQAIALEPDNYDFYEFRSSFYLDKGQKEEAMQDLTVMINQSPARFEAYALRGLILLHSYKYLEAIKDFTNSIKLNPEDEENYRYRALCFHNVSRYREAHKDLSKSIEMLSDQLSQVDYANNLQLKLAETYLQRGLCLTKMGNASNSCSDFLNALDLGVTKGKYYFRKFCDSY